jgi:hypothetical protein
MANAPYLSHEGKSSSITLRGENLDEISPYLIVIFFNARDETEFSSRKLFFTRLLTPPGQALLPCYPEMKFGAGGLPETGAMIVKGLRGQRAVIVSRKLEGEDSGPGSSGITPALLSGHILYWALSP